MKVIYCIRQLSSNLRYVGSAINWQSRKSVHLCQLKKGKHHSKYLQRCWDKYGERDFIFEILEFVENPNMLLDLEQKWIDFFNSYNKGFNSCPFAHNTKGRLMSIEGRIRISNSRKKLSDTQYTEICQRYIKGEYSTVLAKEFGLSGARAICNILKRFNVPRRPRGQQKNRSGSSRKGIKHRVSGA